MKTLAPMMGGTICPPHEATASTAPANSRENPVRIIRGIVNVPVLTTLAIVEPETMPNIELATTDACAGPPRKRPVSANARLMSICPVPVASRRAENKIKMKINSLMMAEMVPKVPSEVSHRYAARRLCSSPWKV